MFVAGSNSSALEYDVAPWAPPAMSTRPSGSGAAAAVQRAVVSDPTPTLEKNEDPDAQADEAQTPTASAIVAHRTVTRTAAGGRRRWAVTVSGVIGIMPLRPLVSRLVRDAVPPTPLALHAVCALTTRSGVCGRARGPSR